MSKESKKYKITIFGESYTLVSDEAEPHVAAAAHTVDDLMTKMAASLGSAGLGPKDAKKIAVLAALQLSSDLHRAQSHLNLHESERQRLAALIDQGLTLCDLA